MTSVDPQLAAVLQSQRDKQWSARCLLACFAYLGIPTSLFDVGCGDGHLVRLAHRLNVASLGIDLNVEDSNLTTRSDLSKPCRGCPSEMVICWELAEHLLISCADALCDMLAESTLKWLLFSAAVPGQGGSGHVNEQSRSYWRLKLLDRGLTVDDKLTTRLRRVFTQVAPTAWWYGQNLIVFVKEKRPNA